jgi:hypothetical protein
MNLVLIWCFLLDFIRVDKNGGVHIALYLSAPLKTRYCRIFEDSTKQQALVLNEADFPLQAPTTGTKQQGQQQNHKQKIVVNSVLIRESDCILTYCLNAQLCSKILRFCETNSRSIITASALIVAVPFITGLVLGIYLSNPQLYLLSLLSLSAVIFRACFWSARVLKFLMKQSWFWLSIFAASFVLSFMSIALTSSGAPIVVVLATLFLDYMCADAIVLPGQSFLQVQSFIPVFVAVLLLPYLVYAGHFQTFTLENSYI